MARIVPTLVCKLTHAYDGWVVGSAADPDTALEDVRDYDILIPFARWKDAAMLIPSDAVPNTFGGWKCTSEGKKIDVWPGDLAWFMTNAMATWAWHPQSGARWKKVVS